MILIYGTNIAQKTNLDYFSELCYNSLKPLRLETICVYRLFIIYCKYAINSTAKAGSYMKKNKPESKRTVVNRRIYVALLIAAIMALFAVGCFKENGIAEGIIFLLIGICCIFYILLSPLYYVFTDRELRIQYCFGLKERAEWDKIKYIGETSDDNSAAPPHLYSYEIHPMQGSKYFFMAGKVSKNRRTRTYIRRYWQKEINGEKKNTKKSRSANRKRKQKK